jgi:nitrogenase-associated protein
MATVVFYEKPGCVNNTPQKRLLAAAGHTVWARNLLTEKWTPMRLRPFFGDLPVARWFNPSAPRVKSGEVRSEDMSEDDAPLAMAAGPLQIRATDRRRAGAPLGMRPPGGMPRPGWSVAGITFRVASRFRRESCSAPRRAPLLEAEGQQCVGFDPAAVDRWIGLKSASLAAGLETCPRNRQAAPCPVPEGVP